ncbi:reverse transcriptase [Salinisphaera sp. C84B14]|uniref:reverse transcriptase family protein n=1 Tax=Salinisphaera sp. C84B14 TaxID=1304155 RepID=UPI00333F63D6
MGYEPQLKKTFRVKSFAKLKELLGLTTADFLEALRLPIDQQYRRKVIPKKSGADRIVYDPHPALRKIQTKFKTRVLKKRNIISWPHYLFGSIPNPAPYEKDMLAKDYVTCAAQHANAGSVLTLDLENFFDNITLYQVEELLKGFFRIEPFSARILARTFCRGDRLVQGAITSSYIASLILYRYEGDVVRRLERKNIRYTRYVDDITVSTKVADHNFFWEQKIITDMVISADLSLNAAKTETQTISTAPIMVHGLRVGFEQPRLSAEELSRIRSAVKGLELLAEIPNYRTTKNYRHEYNRTLGRVNKLKRVGQPKHKNLVLRLNRIKPLPHPGEMRRLSKRIAWLENYYKRNKELNYYRRSFYKTYQDLNILKRSFGRTAAILRARLRAIRPPNAELD